MLPRAAGSDAPRWTRAHTPSAHAQHSPPAASPAAAAGERGAEEAPPLALFQQALAAAPGTPAGGFRLSVEGEGAALAGLLQLWGPAGAREAVIALQPRATSKQECVAGPSDAASDAADVSETVCRGLAGM